MSRPSLEKTASERVRQAYRRLVTAWQMHRSRKADSGLADLQIDAALLADAARGLVFSKYLKSDGPDFILSVPSWLFSERDKLRIEHSRDGVVWTVLHEEIVAFYDTPIPTPYPITLDKNKDQMKLEGANFFRTWIENDVEDVSTSASLPLIFDRTPPYDHAPPTKLSDIAAVTDASLAAAGDKATLTLPGYSDWEAGDSVFVYWMNELPDDFGDLDPPVTTVATTGNDQPVEVPGDAIRAVGDGGVFVIYVLVDKAGNVSEMSVYTSVAVALGTLPTVFDDPVVPLATAGDGYLIDQADAYAGVEVWVPLYDGMKASDWVVVQWGNSPLSPEMVGSAPGDYIRVRVPNEVMLAEYGNGPGAVETDVSYTLRRGTHPMGGADTTIKVDFETLDPAGPDPTWPLPIHPGLKAAVITGRVSGKINELDGTDANSPADLTFELYSFAEEGDELTFYWAGKEAVNYTVVNTDKPGDEIGLEVPWGIIHEAGNATAVPVDYEARRAGVHNPVRSAITSVNVDAITITPVEATFAHLVNGFVTCASIRATAAHPDGPAVEVLIPDLTEYQQYSTFSEVVIRWWVYRGRSDDQGFDIIEEVTLEETIALDSEHPVTGFTWRVPYEDNVLPTYDGSDDPLYTRSRANVKYTLKTAKGDVASDDGKVTLAFIPASGVCDPNG